jgi:hypothetical protein
MSREKLAKVEKFGNQGKPQKEDLYYISAKFNV